MADKTLYDILEVSPGAPSEVVLAAYERLSEKYDPQNPANSGNTDIKILHLAVEEAYLTINNPGKRAQYDKKLEARSRVMYQTVVVIEPFWTTAKFIIIAIIVLGCGGYYYSQKKTEAKLAAETAIAEAQAKEAAEKARSATDEAQLLFAQQQQERMAEERTRRERDQALRQFSYEQRASGYNTESSSMRERQQQQRAESQRQREEQQAANAARNVAAKEKADLCRLERERYGRAISC